MNSWNVWKRASAIAFGFQVVLASAFAQASLTWNREHTTFPFVPSSYGCEVFTTPDGPELFICGDYGPSPSYSYWVQRWHPQIGWRALGNGSSAFFVDDTVLDVQGYDDGLGMALYVCGRFTNPRPGIVRWRPSTGWQILSVPGYSQLYLGAHNPLPRKMIVHDDGNGPGLYIGGGGFGGGTALPSTGSTGSRNIIRYDSSGWHSLAGGVDGGEVWDMCTFDDGTGPALYVAGNFTSAGGVPVNKIARWNGTSWSAVGNIIVNPSPSWWIGALCVYDDGSGPALYANATDTSLGVFLQKWDGQSWTPVVPQPTWVINTMIVYDDGRGPALFCFQQSGNPSGIVRFDGQTWTGLGQGLTGALQQFYPLVAEFAVYDAGRGPELHAVGSMDRAGGGIVSRGVASWRNLDGRITRVCSGDGTLVSCPCPGFGAPTRGCPNSHDAGGTDLDWSGLTQDDSLALHTTGLPPSSALVVYQGSNLNLNSIFVPNGSPHFGDGLRCATGVVRRLYVGSANSGSYTAPEPGQPSLRARAMAAGDPLPSGAVRILQVWYRDAATDFCVPQAGWNTSNALRVVW